MTVKIPTIGANVITETSNIITPSSQSALPFGKLNILFCYIDEPQATTGNYYVKALRELGHNVITCGPRQGNVDGELLSRLDIPLYDKPSYPDTYPYQEILDQCPTTPELIIQAEPHFFFVGSKADRRNIPAVYITFDNHRGPLTHIDMYRKGSFDIMFVANKYYQKPYIDSGVNAQYLPVACDPSLHKTYPDEQEECDIVFAGNPGYNNSGQQYKELCLAAGIPPDASGQFRFYDKIGKSCLPDEIQPRLEYRCGLPAFLVNAPPDRRFANWHSREYCERAEYLMRLSRDFSLNVYSCCVLENYARVINRGRMTFNCSLRNDLNMKVFESIASGKLLITDAIPYQEEIFTHGVHYITYNKYYQPDNVNFNLDYQEVRNLVSHFLNHPDEREQIAKAGQQHAHTHHSYQVRSKQVLNAVFGG
ncbi:glycosyltransferase [candidate division WOR-3 bacterium]|nr:glycosyltransferase [candidate division WOR-3 bacterium]